MSSVSNELIWALTKKTSKFTVLRKPQQYGGASFSRDQFNVTSLNAYKYTGIRDQAISISTSSKGKLTLRTKKADAKNKVASGIKKSTTKKRGFNNQGKWILKKLNGSGYRMDIARKALLKVAKLNTAQHKKLAKVKKVKQEKVAVVEKK